MTKKNDAPTLSKNNHKVGFSIYEEIAIPAWQIREIDDWQKSQKWYLTPEEKEVFISARKELDGLFVLLKEIGRAHV